MFFGEDWEGVFVSGNIKGFLSGWYNYAHANSNTNNSVNYGGFSIALFVSIYIDPFFD